MDGSIIFSLLLLGAGVGFMAGLLGIGGGMIIVPFLTMLLPHVGVSDQWLIHASIATSMASIVFTSMSSVRAHQAKDAILWPIVFIMAPGVILGGLLSGGAVFAYLSGFGLSLFFALFIGYSGFRMLRPRPVPPSRTMPGSATTFGVGTGIGFVSGLVGAGGGFLSVPFMTRSNVSIHNAVATSAALGFFIAVANSTGYIYSGFSVVKGQAGMLGYIYWPAMLMIAVMSVLTAPMGARFAHSLPVGTLRRIFAFLLFALAAYMLVKAWQQI